MLVSPTRMMVIQAASGRPSLDIDFLSGGALDSRITFTRASAGWAYNSAGTLTSYATNTPRFDYDPVTLVAKGLLIEEARTNSLRNSSGGGSVAGTSGTLPTNWNQPSITTGITRTIVGSGTLNGLPYVDIQYSGTASGATDTALFYESSSNIATVNATTWTASTHLALVGGSLSGVTVKQGLRYRAAAGASIGSQVFETTIVPTATLTRYERTATASDATVAFVVPTLILTLAVGAIDVTLRHAVPQIELGSFATSPILTTTVAVTRAADVATITPLGSWFSTVAGTVLAEVGFPDLFGTINSTVWQIDDGTANNRLFLYGSSGTNTLYDIRAGGVQQINIARSGWLSAGVVAKAAAAWATNDAQAAFGGTLGTADTSITVPTGLTTLRLGATSAVTQGRTHFRRLRVYDQRLPNSTLQTITS